MHAPPPPHVQHPDIPNNYPLTAKQNKNNELVEWDARTFAKKSSRPLKSEARALAVSPNSKLMAVVTFDGVSVHDVGVPISAAAAASATAAQSAPLSPPLLFGRRDDPVQVCVERVSTCSNESAGLKRRSG